MGLAPDRLETPRVGMRPGRRVLFHDLEHIVYGMEAGDLAAARAGGCD